MSVFSGGINNTSLEAHVEALVLCSVWHREGRTVELYYFTCFSDAIRRPALPFPGLLMEFSFSFSLLLLSSDTYLAAVINTRSLLNKDLLVLFIYH